MCTAGCRHVSDEAVSRIIARSPRLSTISLAMMGQLSGEALAISTEHGVGPSVLRNLVRFACLSPCKTHGSVINRMAHACTHQPTNLDQDITGCGGISYMALERVMSSGGGLALGSHLTELSLRGHVAIPAEGILAVLEVRALDSPGGVTLSSSIALNHLGWLGSVHISARMAPPVAAAIPMAAC